MSGATKSSTSLFSFLGFSELPDWYVGSKYRYADSKWIVNDFGTKIHYRDVGEGPVIVLLHGEISSLHTWEKWIEALSQDFRVIALDLPGSGLTSAPHCISDPEESCPENLTSDYLVHTIQYFIEDMEIPKFTLVGSSYSGYLAAQYAAHQHPEKIEKLILMSPMGFEQELPWILNYMTTPGMDIFNTYIQPTSVITTIVDNFYGDKSLLNRATLDRYIHLAQSEGAHESNVRQLLFVRSLMELGMLLDLDEIIAPTLVMWGGEDKWGKLDHAQRWVDALGNATKVIYDFNGHALMEELPEETVTDVIAFINDEPLPTIEGLGSGAFTIEEADAEIDREGLFESAPPTTDTNENSEEVAPETEETEETEETDTY